MEKSYYNTKVQKNINDVYEDLLGNNALLCMFAVRYCVLNAIKDDKTISIISSLKNSPLIEWNTCKISNCAYAALHLLGVEIYQENDGQVQDLIDTVFFTQL